MTTGNSSFRTVGDAFSAVTWMIEEDIHRLNLNVQLDRNSPGKDQGKFVLNGKVARAIHIFDGYHLPIRLEWFDGHDPKPKVWGEEFDYYVFAVEPRAADPNPHYFIVDYKQIREWVLEFDAPKGNDWRDQSHWMAAIRPFSDGTGYFRWGDESRTDLSEPGRQIDLDNVESLVVQAQPTGGGSPRGSGGESERHKRLKQYVADNPGVIGLGPSAKAELEHTFLSGDRVDVLFEGGGSLAVPVEIELEGARNLLVGVHQAAKYAALAALEFDQRIDFTQKQAIRPVVVAHHVDYPEVMELAEKYSIELVQIPEDNLNMFAP